MKRTPLRKVSAKQKVKNDLWAKVKLKRIKYLNDKFGFTICEKCGCKCVEGREFRQPDPHHIDKNRNHNVYENCMILCRLCHGSVHDNNLDVSIYRR